MSRLRLHSGRFSCRARLAHLPLLTRTCILAGHERKVKTRMTGKTTRQTGANGRRRLPIRHAKPGAKPDNLPRRLQECTTDLESAQKELESFCYSVSHDLRAPLRSIDGFSHALQHEFGDKLEPPAREYLQRIVDSSKRMARLIDELLVLSRIQRVELSPENFNLSEVAVDIMRGIRKTEPRRKAYFSAAPNLRVCADRKLLTTALQKLLENAWKFTSNTTAARIEFSEVSNGPERTFMVRDNGVGFNMTYASKLFKAFQRLHAQTEYPGVGTGLAVTRAIILRHRGRAWAESAAGKGASFYFTLPAMDVPRQLPGSVQKKSRRTAGF